jgi:hypothetical protein
VETRQPTLNLSYDPRDPQAQLIAERIALNARDVGITVQVSLSGAADIRLMRIVLPSPDPATSLSEAARQIGLPLPSFPIAINGSSLNDRSLDDLYRAERRLLDGYAVIPLFHLPLASAASTRVRNSNPDPLSGWSVPGFSASGVPANTLANVWLADSPREAASR